MSMSSSMSEVLTADGQLPRAASPVSTATAAAAAVAAAVAAAKAASKSSGSLQGDGESEIDESMVMDHLDRHMGKQESGDIHSIHDTHDMMLNETSDIRHEHNESNDQQPSHDTSNLTATSSAIPLSTASTPQKERHSLTLDQRRALRRWANSQLSRPSHKQCMEWFQHQFHQSISQSTVSHSLSPKYARLDGEPQLSGSRLRFGNWPEVEKLVLLWYQQTVHSGRHPTNDELGEKAKSIFTQLPRHRGDEPPEFSPGWIHRFKKRYGLLVRRQRRPSANVDNMSGISTEPASDIAYLIDAVPRYMNVITTATDPLAIRATAMTSLGVEPSIATCTRVRDEIARYNADAEALAPLAESTTESQANAATAAAAAVAVAAAAAAALSAGTPGAGVDSSEHQQHHQPQHQHQPHEHQHHQLQGSNGDVASAFPSSSVYHPPPDEDPEMVLQAALRQMQEEEDAAAEAEAAKVLATSASAQQQMATPTQAGVNSGDSPTSGSLASGSASNRPMRCPFCVNQRMLRSIKEAVDHMSTHVELS